MRLPQSRARAAHLLHIEGDGAGADYRDRPAPGTRSVSTISRLTASSARASGMTGTRGSPMNEKNRRRFIGLIILLLAPYRVISFIGLNGVSADQRPLRQTRAKAGGTTTSVAWSCAQLLRGSLLYS